MSYKNTLRFSRFALFLVYFWFGVLKIFGKSPASPLVTNLFNETMGKMLPFITIDNFLVFLGIAEAILGILFLMNRFPRTVFTLTCIHLFTTTLPLFVLPQEMWSGLFVPTLEGQYIIKNILILALAFSVTLATMKPKLKMPGDF